MVSMSLSKGLNRKTNDKVKSVYFKNSDFLWNHLIHTQRRGNRLKIFIFHDHADAEWRLALTIYRFKPTCGLNILKDTTQTVEPQQIEEEFYLLKHFIYRCDEEDVSISNDSINFRNRSLSEIKLEE